MKKWAGILLVLLGVKGFSQIPKLGNDSLLDIATWNVEWLGESGYGPTDENLQYNNVKALITQTDFDIIALEEMSHPNTYFNLSDQLFGTYLSITSTFSATQKMCLYYKKSMFEIIPGLSKNILNQYASGAFATRPPLQVALKTLGGDRTDTLYFIVVHLKAHTGSTTEKQDSYNKRIQAADYLKMYVEQYLAGKKYIIFGDWNDDLNNSIYNSAPTPFKQFLDAGYLFASKQLTDVGKRSYAFGTKMIDHIMLAKSMDSLYISTSSRVFDNAGMYIPNFSNNTSDHYPVYAFFDWKRLTTNPVKPNPPVGIAETGNETLISIYPNPAQDMVSFSKPVVVTIYDALGREHRAFNTPQTLLDISPLENGIYIFKIETEGIIAFERVVVKK